MSPVRTDRDLWRTAPARDLLLLQGEDLRVVMEALGYSQLTIPQSVLQQATEIIQ